MAKQRRFDALLGFLSDLLFFVYINARHYSLALWGLRLRLDPDYPIVTRFFGRYITDTVLEYRSYALLLWWGGTLAFWLSDLPELLWVLIAVWAVQSFRRARYYTSPFEFWLQAWKETPSKGRVVTKCAENVLMELERQMKAGASWEECQPLMDLGTKLVNDVATKPMSPIARPSKGPA